MCSKSPCQWLREERRCVQLSATRDQEFRDRSCQECWSHPWSSQSGSSTKTRNYSILSVTDITLVIYFATVTTTGNLFRVVLDETVWFSQTNESVMWSKTQTLVVAQLETKSELFIISPKKKLMLNNHYWLTSNHVNYC